MSSSELGHVEITEFLFDVESRRNLFSWRIDNIPVWEYVRFPLHRAILREARDQEPSVSLDSYQDLAKGGYLWARNFLVKNPMFGNADVLGFGMGRRKQHDDGYWWDIYFDHLYQAIDLEYLHVEQPYANQHRSPAKTENLRYIELVQYSGALAYHLGLCDANLTNTDLERIEGIESDIDGEFGLSIDLRDIVERKLVKAKAKKPLFDLFLRRVDPEVAVLTCSYEKETFVKSCQDNGIPVVELQHGAIDPHHPGYVFPGEKKTLFPDYLFVWGRFWKENIEFAIPDENVMAVGYPYQEEQSSKYIDLEKRKRLTIISQPSNGEEISKFAVNLAGDNRISLDVSYKVHPKQYDDWAEVYPWLESSDVEVIASDSPPLYEILARSRAIVGVSSTVIYEALNFGPEIFLLNLPSIEMVKWLNRQSNVHIIDSVDDFVSQYEGEILEVDTTRFFENNALERVEEAMKSVIYGDY